MHFDNFVPDACIIGKGMQLSALLALGAARFQLCPKGPDTTTWPALYGIRLYSLLLFLTGRVPLVAVRAAAEKAGGSKGSLPPIPQPLETFRASAEGDRLHADIAEVMREHWGKEAWDRKDIWGCGLFWYCEESLYQNNHKNNVTMSALDEENIVRLILQLRPLSRLIPHLKVGSFLRLSAAAQGKRWLGRRGEGVAAPPLDRLALLQSECASSTAKRRALVRGVFPFVRLLFFLIPRCRSSWCVVVHLLAGPSRALAAHYAH